MELFRKLFGSLLTLVYHSFDRLVINGYLSGLSRPENVVYLFRTVRGEPAVTQELLAQRTREYQGWVESYARNRKIPIVWGEKGARKEDYVEAAFRRAVRRRQFGVYFIFKSMEQGATFRSVLPKFPTADPGYRLLYRKRGRFTPYYFYLRDEVLGRMIVRVGSFLPFHCTYWLNGHDFIENQLRRRGRSFRQDDNAFLATDDPRALQAAADRLTPEVIRERLEFWTFPLAPKFSARERRQLYLGRCYAVAQVEYCRNFVFRRHFPIHKIFERSCDLGLMNLTAGTVSQIFGVRLTKHLRGKLQTTVESVQHGHHVFRAYFKSSFLRQYEKFRTFLRQEICSNNLADFRLKKGRDHLLVARQRFLEILDRFSTFQAQALNVPVDFPLLQRLARPIVLGRSRIPGIKIHDTRLIRLLEVLLHTGSRISGWRTADIHQAILDSYGLAPQDYRLSHVRYDLRKLTGHGLLQRDGRRYAYRLTDKGAKVALLMVLFHKRICGPLAHSLFHHRPDQTSRPNSKVEAAYQRADAAIQDLIDLLKAA